MFNQFKSTRNLFLKCIEYDETNPLTYDDWMNIPDEYKSAVLYVRFYDQITLAWSKFSSTGNASPEDAIEIVLQYLEKNVSVIKDNSKKFTPNWIYRIAYNCLYCECLERPLLKNIKEHEIREEYELPDGSYASHFDVFDNCITREVNSLDSIRKEQLELLFWEDVENLDIESQVILERWMCGPYRELWKSLNDGDPTAKKRPPQVTPTTLKDSLDKLKQVLIENNYPVDEYLSLVE